jgi:hypothetical protein
MKTEWAQLAKLPPVDPDAVMAMEWMGLGLSKFGMFTILLCPPKFIEQYSCIFIRYLW